jgi:Methylase involved in ubiquinone/menaquinone biosynthesis
MRDIARYTDNYMEIPFEEYQIRYRRKKVIEIVEKYPHDRILEVGCGLRPLFFDFDDYREMTVVEPSDVFVNNALKSDRLSPKVMVKKGFLEAILGELENNEYDYIVVTSLLHEVEDPTKLLKTLKSLCSNSTVIHIVVPNAFSIHRLIAYKMGMIDDVHNQSMMQKLMLQNSTFDLCSLSELVKALEFEVLEKGSFFPKFFTHKQMQKMMDQGIISEEVLDGMYALEEYLPEYGSEIYINIMLKR